MMISVIAAAAAVQDPIAIEQAFAATRENGAQWAAFRALADPEAVLFVQARAVDAAPPRPAPVAATRIAASLDVMTACDGSLAVTNGTVEWAGGGHGRYHTVWRRGADGRWRWVLHGRWQMAAPYEPSTLRVPHPTCPTTARTGGEVVPGERGGSNDGSLRWFYIPTANGRGDFAINAWVRRGYLAVINGSIAVPPVKL